MRELIGFFIAAGALVFLALCIGGALLAQAAFDAIPQMEPGPLL